VIAEELLPQANKASDRPDRRTFPKRSGLADGTLAALGNLPLGAVRRAEQTT
jgi:formate dehydrogenase major subunit